MKKKIVLISLTFMFILITGICYSCAYHNKSAKLVTTISEESDELGKTDNTEEISSSSDADASNITDNTSITDKNLQGNLQSDITGTSIVNSSENGSLSEIMLNQTEKVITSCIYVHICGAVNNPGVYQVKSGARLIELIKLAGGLTKDAAGDYMNQAQLVSDGQRVYIPSKDELHELSTQEYMTGEQSNSDNSVVNGEENNTIESSVTSEESALININTADKEELMSISGIGEAKANSIIAYREKNGKFKTIEELMNIPGIKEGLFSQISFMIIAN